MPNKERRRQVKFCNDDEVPSLINSPFFREKNAIDDDTYTDLPLQIGFFLCINRQYARLRMLQFYRDFSDKYLHTSDYEYCEMDRDCKHSSYIAIIILW